MEQETPGTPLQDSPRTIDAGSPTPTTNLRLGGFRPLKRPLPIEVGRTTPRKPSGRSPGHSHICQHTNCTRCQERHPSQPANHVCCTKIQNLSVRAGSRIILDNVSLHIHCGELTAIIGRNGAGKTTFFRTLLGEVPHSGEIHFMKDGCTCTSTPRFGYVPQQLAVEANSPISVSDLVLASLSRRPVWLPRRKKDLELVEQVLSVTKVAALAKSRVCDLSGGEIQRILLALAIHPVPDILLLDEPVSGVDRAGLSLFYQLVSDLRHTHDITILLISHDLDLVARHADKVVLLDKKIAEDGPPAQVYQTQSFREIFGESGGLRV